jgi:hypothetical protein
MSVGEPRFVSTHVLPKAGGHEQITGIDVRVLHPVLELG